MQYSLGARGQVSGARLVCIHPCSIRSIGPLPHSVVRGLARPLSAALGFIRTYQSHLPYTLTPDSMSYTVFVLPATESTLRSFEADTVYEVEITHPLTGRHFTDAGPKVRTTCTCSRACRSWHEYACMPMIHAHAHHACSAMHA